MDEGMAIYGIGQLGVAVNDLDRAEAFYRDVLRLPPLFRSAELAAFDCNGLRLLLSRTAGNVPGQGSCLYFRSEFIDDAFARFARLGVRITEAPRRVARMANHDLWIGRFEDSEGNALALMEEREPAH